MKRVWFAVFFLALAVSLCLFEQHTVKTSFENVTTMLDSMLVSAENEDYKSIEKQCRQLENFWTSKYSRLCAVSENSQLAEAKLTIFSIKELAKEKDDETIQKITQVKNEINAIYDNTKVSLGNIF